MVIFFNSKYNINCSIVDYNKVTQNIPKVLIQAIKNNIMNIASPRLHKIKIDYVDLVDKKCNNKFLKQTLVNCLYPGRTRSTLFFLGYNKYEISSIRTKFLRYPIPPKFKEVHFKTINNIYPSNEFVKKRFKFEVDNCHICNIYVETTEHLFYECQMAQNLWKSLHSMLSSRSINIDFFSYQNIQMGVILQNKNDEFLVNNLIIATKYYIHKCRFAKSSPTWSAFKNELLLFQNCLKKVENAQAKKLYNRLISLQMS